MCDWLWPSLVCPRDRLEVTRLGSRLECENGHQYPIVDGIPVLLTADPDPTHPYCSQTLDVVQASAVEPAALVGATAIDSFVQDEIVRTNGNLYRHLRGRLPRYPIPEIRLPQGQGKTLLDVGCNWGRWSVAAASKGYRVVGVDPWIEAVRAARRVTQQLGVEAAFVVGDARHLPFREGTFDASFSYSVLQHFSKDNARSAILEMSRVTCPAGTIMVQMPNVFGLRQALNWIRHCIFREQAPFRVRYWRPDELQNTFDTLVGPTTLSVDGFFSLNAQESDIDLLPRHYALLVSASRQLRRLSASVPALWRVADSLYVQSLNAKSR